MEKTLRSIGDDRVRAYIVWLPIFGGDFKGESAKLSASFNDSRVSYFSDSQSLTGWLWNRVLSTRAPIAWDVYMLYQAGAPWDKELPPPPDFWMHQLGKKAAAPPLDEPAFTAKLREMLTAMKQSAPNKSPVSSGKTRIEFLYFERCPGHKQALANLKSALRASGTRADITLTNVKSDAEAEKIGFQGSPSIRINGKDLDGQEDGYLYGCRIYRIDGKIAAVPTRKFIEQRIKALLR